jgi:hypothetical protein
MLVSCQYHKGLRTIGRVGRYRSAISAVQWVCMMQAPVSGLSLLGTQQLCTNRFQPCCATQVMRRYHPCGRCVVRSSDQARCTVMLESSRVVRTLMV